MKLGLIYPHQLFEKHPVIEHSDEQFLVADALIIGGDKEWPLKPHAQKLLLHISSMSVYAERFSLKMVRSLDEIDLEKYSEIVVCRLFDDVLEERLRLHSPTFNELDSPGFVTPKEWGESFFNTGKKPFMKTFYEAQRKRMGILIDPDGSPTGGRWSYDDENRKKFPLKETPPSDPDFKATIEEQQSITDAKEWIKKMKLETVGEDKDFRYPITHESARKWLEDFLITRFDKFGTYEDAISHRSTFLYHSVLTPMLNIGLLTPLEIVEKAVKVADEKGIEINNLEGFVRQIIGWREFMSIMYLKHGRYLRTQNFWGFKDQMPKSIYQLKTGIPPVDDVLQKVNKEGYAHHIERLMIMGNFFMLLRIKPDDVFQWFSEFFVDAYDWVMVPNVYGMSQFSDGGLMVTKPYISGSNYIRKMSDYKAGEWCDVWDALFWSFIDDHRDYFSKQYRMKMMVSHLVKMGGEKLAEHHKLAAKFRKKLQIGGFLGDDLELL